MQKKLLCLCGWHITFSISAYNPLILSNYQILKDFLCL